MERYIRWFWSPVFLLLCVGSSGAETAVISENPKQLRVVIGEDRAQRELEADGLKEAGAFDAAIEIYEALLDDCQADLSLSEETRLSLISQYAGKMAACYQGKGDYAKALEQYQFLLTVGEERGSEAMRHSALLDMGKLTLDFGRGDGVIEIFERRRAQLRDDLLILLGDLYKMAGQQVYLGLLEVHLGHHHQGKVLIACYGVPPEQRVPLEREILAKCPDLATELKKRAEKGDAQAQLLLGELAWEQAEYEAALTEFRKAEALMPEDPMIGLQVARTFITLCRAQEAVEKLHEIAVLLNGPGELLELGTACQLAGSGGAGSIFRTLVATHPDSPEAREAQLRLCLMDKAGL